VAPQNKITQAWINGRGKRTDVTALLLYAKGQELLDPEKYEALCEEMIKLGIDVGMKGASCTLSQTSDKLSLDIEVCPPPPSSLVGHLPFLKCAPCSLTEIDGYYRARLTIKFGRIGAVSV
jgi:hypothetical protein